MATVKRGKRKAPKQGVAYQSMPVAVLAAVMGGGVLFDGHVADVCVARQWRDLHAAFAMGHHQCGHWRGGVYHRLESEA